MICHRLCGILLFLCYMLHFTKASMPVFGQALYTPPKITEGLPPGSSYFTFKATDSTPSDVLTYRLDAKASVWFSIDSSSGVAIVKKTIDREVMTGFFRYKVYASDGTNEASAEVIQEIGEINDNPPLFKNLPKSINISEDLTVGSLVFTASADDADGPPFDRSEYSIESGDKDGTFAVPNSAEGKITLKKPLDYEKKIQYVLTILVKDTGSDLLNDTSVLTINIVNIDGPCATFDKNLNEATIIKNSLMSTVVTTVQAEDGDGLNASVYYSLYQVLVYVLTPLIVIIVLLVIVIGYLVWRLRKCKPIVPEEVDIADKTLTDNNENPGIEQTEANMQVQGSTYINNFGGSPDQEGKQREDYMELTPMKKEPNEYETLDAAGRMARETTTPLSQESGSRQYQELNEVRKDVYETLNSQGQNTYQAGSYEFMNEGFKIEDNDNLEA